MLHSKLGAVAPARLLRRAAPPMAAVVATIIESLTRPELRGGTGRRVQIAGRAMKLRRRSAAVASPGRRHRTTLAVALCALAISPGVAHAEPATRINLWQFELTPYGWFAGLSGNLRTPLARAPERSINADFGSIAGDLSAIPIMGMAEVRYGRFGLVGDILYLGLEQGINTRDVLFQGGHARVNTTIGSALGLFRVLDLPSQSLDIGAGTRIWSVNTKLSLNPGRLGGVIQRDSVSWADPLLAARYRIGLTDRLGLSVYGDIGGFGAGSTLTWQAMGSLDYRVSQSVVLRAGWRYLEVDKKRGDYRLDLGFNGPFIAATFRF